MSLSLEINAEYKQKYIWHDGNGARLVVMNGDFYVLESLFKSISNRFKKLISFVCMAAYIVYNYEVNI